MKRYPTLLLLACWLVLLYVVSTITFAAFESEKSDSPKKLTSQNLHNLEKQASNY